MASNPEAIQPLVMADVAAWRDWLLANDETSDGVWLLLAKKGVTSPTSLSYMQALEEALCSGWIDGQSKSVDDATFRQRFTPRRARSLWSQRNVVRVGELAEAGRMRARGFAEIERAKADGRWEAAYPGAATAEVPPELARALDAAPQAKAAFEKLSRSARYSALHPILTARRPDTVQRRIERLISSLLE